MIVIFPTDGATIVVEGRQEQFTQPLAARQVEYDTTDDSILFLNQGDECSVSADLVRRILNPEELAAGDDAFSGDALARALFTVEALK